MDNRVQVDSYPGCNMAHATYLLRNKTPTSPSTKTVILHFGLNDKSRSNPPQKAPHGSNGHFPVLEEHYEGVIGQARRELGQVAPIDHQQAWEVAGKEI
ncbi:hypothetical protein EYF80_058873 [Liparis tanakae]|uniref:Uncharacterized protein n=1 Tax=Liparis tanakae TaxID=230148 RepID=A0A4Z2EPZ2_9TELE|nr:hypothetical protein EYF80_058873 [Liparis tanakae]